MLHTIPERTRTFLVALLMLPALSGLMWCQALTERTQSVPGFVAKFTPCDTPEAAWGTAQEETWVTSLKGTLTIEKSIGYRQDTIAPGTYDFWIEKGKGDWFHLVIGRADDQEFPRINAAFRLYEQEKGVKQLDFQLKLTRKETKLKFSVFAGTSEGHGNLRIVSADETSED
ncbi:MAG: hypothetical protein AB7O52_10320 [Planctomycetota bacterium]